MKRYFILIILCLFSKPIIASNEIQITGGCTPEHSASLAKNSDLILSSISYCEGGDSATGEITLQFPISNINLMDFYFSGYPNDDSVRLELKNSKNEVVKITPHNKGDQWYPLKVNPPQEWSKTDILRLIITDESKSWTGWAGVGYSAHKIFSFDGINYLLFFIKAFIIISITIIPGIWLNTSGIKDLPIGFAPIPGVLILSLIGLVFWFLPYRFNIVFYWLVYGFYSILLLDIIRKIFRRQKSDSYFIFKEWNSDTKTSALIAALVFFQALLIGITPLPVAQESYTGSDMPGRMIASPPDHMIPYQTAIYLYHQYDGIDHSKDFFGDWNITSRGPLMPLGINALFHIFNVDVINHVSNPKDWPNSITGEDIARIYGWALNSLVLIGAFQLLSALGVSCRAKKSALVWLALSPVIIINTVFLWPKLLAIYFIIITIVSIIKQRPYLAGFLSALAWLSHPIGALMMPPLILFSASIPSIEGKVFINIKKWFKISFPIILSLIITMAPWLIYKAHLGYNDAFMAYVLGWGHGTEKAPDIQSWLSVRASNFWLTLSPAAFFYSQNMNYWSYGPIQDTLRWSIQYAKTLPGNIGFSCFLIAYLALFTRQHKSVLKAIKRWIILAGFFLMIIFWGFSGDGLGRNSLEPISILLIIFAVASNHSSLRWLPILLPLLSIESQSIVWSGFLYAPGFETSMVKVDAWACIIFNTMISIILLAIYFYRSSFRTKYN